MQNVNFLINPNFASALDTVLARHAQSSLRLGGLHPDLSFICVVYIANTYTHIFFLQVVGPVLYSILGGTFFCSM